MLNSSSNEAHPISKAIRSWQQVFGFVFLLSHCKAQRVFYESSLSTISFPAEKPRLPTNIAVKFRINLNKNIGFERKNANDNNLKRSLFRRSRTRLHGELAGGSNFDRTVFKRVKSDHTTMVRQTANWYPHEGC